MKFLKEILFIFLVAFVFAGITGAVNHRLDSRIRLNAETRMSGYLLDVLGISVPPDADAETIHDIQRSKVAKETLKGMPIYAVLDAHGKPETYAFDFGGKGFWGGIKGLVALDKDLDTIKGIVITEHGETPGLGARIEEDWFRDQFKGLKLSDRPDKDRFIVVGRADPNKKNTVDAITGATMTSTLLQAMLNKDFSEIYAMKNEIRSLKWPSHHQK